MGDLPEVKKAWLSKTVWANLIMAVLPLIPLDGIQDVVHNNPEVLFGLFAAVNLLLRFITKGEIQLK